MNSIKTRQNSLPLWVLSWWNTSTKNHKGKHHLFMIFHIRKGLLALLADRPFLIWKIINRWPFPYGFWWGYSVATKLMGVREFWRVLMQFMKTYGGNKANANLDFFEWKRLHFQAIFKQKQLVLVIFNRFGHLRCPKTSFRVPEMSIASEKGKINLGKLS